MTSPVDTSVKHWSSLMDGTAKPTLNGVVGSLIALIDALIAGFDTKSCTITVAGTVATIAWSGLHSCTQDSVVMIAGCTGAWTALNGEQKIVAKTPGAASATFNVAGGTTAGAVAGTITVAMAPMAGWTKAFTGTNIAAYKSTDPLSSGCYLYIDDTNAQFVRVNGYETLTSISPLTGSGPFPTTAQMSGGGYWPKACISNAVACAWVLVADTRLFYFHPMPGVSTSVTYQLGTTRGFGDTNPLRLGGDPWCCMLNYSITSTPASQYDGQLDSNSPSLGSALARSYTGLGGSTLYACIGYSFTTPSTSGADSCFGGFPNPIDGALRLSKKFFSTSSAGGSPRCEPPGLYVMPMTGGYDSFKFGNYVVGTGVLAGKDFFVVNPNNIGSMTSVPTSVNTGAAFIDVTGPWR